MVFTVSGDVQRAGVYELPMGTSLRDLVFQSAGGPYAGRAIKALLFGVSNPVITPSLLDTPLDFGSMQKAGSGLGSGGVIVYDETTCMVQVAHKLSEFLYIESCGQCTPCKFGTNQATYYLHKLVHGLADRHDLDLVLEGAAMAPHANRCYLPVEHSLLVPSIAQTFAEEFARHFMTGCRACRPIGVPKIVDFDASTASFTYARPAVTTTHTDVSSGSSPEVQHVRFSRGTRTP
jgi:NADH:ubiquinone oxidoreductase subunit F (NADH-binding)